MNATTKAAHIAKHKAHKPEPKRGKSRKNKGKIAKESNAALVAKNERLIQRALHDIGALEYTCRVLDTALRLSCAPRGLTTVGKTAEAYCAEAEKAIKEEMKNDTT